MTRMLVIGLAMAAVLALVLLAPAGALSARDNGRATFLSGPTVTLAAHHGGWGGHGWSGGGWSGRGWGERGEHHPFFHHGFDFDFHFGHPRYFAPYYYYQPYPYYSPYYYSYPWCY